MSWFLTTFGPPIVSGLIIFLLQKNFQNKPHLIVFFSHISAHTLPINSNYPVYIYESTVSPNINNLNRMDANTLPIIIKNNDSFWVYGRQTNGNTVLIQTEKPDIYRSIIFSTKITQLNNPPQNIYDDIMDLGAHQNKLAIGTHAIIVRNTGKMPATNVKIGHKFLPNYDIYPDTDFKIINLENGTQEIFFPRLVPNEQIRIAYLYFYPVPYTAVNTYYKFDDGFANVIEVIPTPSLSANKKRILYFLLFSGITSIIYLIIFITPLLYNLFLLLRSIVISGNH